MKGPMALTLLKRLALTGMCAVGATFAAGSTAAWASTSGGGNGAAAGSSHHANHPGAGSAAPLTPTAAPVQTASTAIKASAVSSNSPSTTAPTVSFSGGHSASTPYVPSAQPIYSPIKPATSGSTSALSTSSGHPVVYRAAVSTLAFSGSDDGPLAIIGGLTVLSGLGLVALSRRTTA